MIFSSLPDLSARYKLFVCVDSGNHKVLCSGWKLTLHEWKWNVVSSQDLNCQEQGCWWDQPFWHQHWPAVPEPIPNPAAVLLVGEECVMLDQIRKFGCSLWGVRNYFSRPLEKSIWYQRRVSPVKGFNLEVLLTSVWVKSFICQGFQPVQGDFKERLLLAFMVCTKVKQTTKLIYFKSSLV